MPLFQPMLKFLIRVSVGWSHDACVMQPRLMAREKAIVVLSRTHSIFIFNAFEYCVDYKNSFYQPCYTINPAKENVPNVYYFRGKGHCGSFMFPMEGVFASIYEL